MADFTITPAEWQEADDLFARSGHCDHARFSESARSAVIHGIVWAKRKGQEGYSSGSILRGLLLSQSAHIEHSPGVHLIRRLVGHRQNVFAALDRLAFGLEMAMPVPGLDPMFGCDEGASDKASEACQIAIRIADSLQTSHVLVWHLLLALSVCDGSYAQLGLDKFDHSPDTIILSDGNEKRVIAKLKKAKGLIDRLSRLLPRSEDKSVSADGDPPRLGPLSLRRLWELAGRQQQPSGQAQLANDLLAALGFTLYNPHARLALAFAANDKASILAEGDRVLAYYLAKAHLDEWDVNLLGKMPCRVACKVLLRCRKPDAPFIDHAIARMLPAGLSCQGGQAASLRSTASSPVWERSGGRDYRYEGVVFDLDSPQYRTPSELLEWCHKEDWSGIVDEIPPSASDMFAGGPGPTYVREAHNFANVRRQAHEEILRRIDTMPPTCSTVEPTVFVILCPNCFVSYKIQRVSLNKKTKCPTCKQVFVTRETAL